MAIPGGLLLGPLSPSILFAISLGVSLSLIFFGRLVVKELVFVLGGLAGAVVATTLSAPYLSAAGLLVIALAGFVLGGLFAAMLLPLGIGLAFGVLGYALVANLLANQILAITVGGIAFVLGIAFSGEALSLISVILGSLLLSNVLTFMGLQEGIAILSATGLGVLGFRVQTTSPVRFAQTPQPTGTPKRGRRNLVLAAATIAAVVLVAAMVSYTPSISQTIQSSSLFQKFQSLIPTGTNSSTTTESGLGFTVYSPAISGANANISFPTSYRTLGNYSLGLINQDRAKAGLSPVILSPVESGQQHSDSMLYFGYFNHFDTQGYKPYMRYTLLGGTADVEENFAYESWYGPHYYRLSDVESAISSLEYQMMYNDSQCCNNGHRDNILNTHRTRVSIGIAFNIRTLYFVEDFENYFADISFSVTGQSYLVSITGTPTQLVHSTEVAVFYDPSPQSQTPSQLSNGPREYSTGTLVGGVLPQCTISCPYFPGDITVYATTWQFDSAHVALSFSMKNFIQKYGSGVYTIYIIPGTDTGAALTSISVFVSG